MATDPEPPITYVDPSTARRDLAAVALMAIGVVGVVAMAFLADWKLGASALFALTATAGVALGLHRTER